VDKVIYGCLRVVSWVGLDLDLLCTTEARVNVLQQCAKPNDNAVDQRLDPMRELPKLAPYNNLILSPILSNKEPRTRSHKLLPQFLL